VDDLHLKTRDSAFLLRLALAIGVGLVFGAVDQYLGASWISDHVGAWTIGVSGLSAPWLALAFVFGRGEDQAWRAATVGLVATLAGLVGYVVMINSPIEGVALSHVDIVQAFRSQLHIFAPALLTGPAFGWLGHRWRVSRSAASAALVAAAFCLEPLVTRLAQHLPYALSTPAPVGVSAGEAAVGVVVGVYFVAVRSKSLRRRST
jgi:hypothetical protein